MTDAVLFIGEIRAVVEPIAMSANVYTRLLFNAFELIVFAFDDGDGDGAIARMWDNIAAAMLLITAARKDALAFTNMHVFK